MLGVFDQPDDKKLPFVVYEFHAARRAAQGEYGDTERLIEATAALRSAVEEQGGRWEVGRLLYRVDEKGLWVEQAPAAAPLVGAGAGAASVSGAPEP